MRFGCCTGIDGISAVENAGYDYVELPVGACLPESPESEWDPVMGKIRRHRIKPETWNIMLPPDLKITGPNVDSYRVERYLRTAYKRISSVGGELIVFGSGPARTVPEGFAIEKGKKQILEFLALCAEVGAEYEITTAIESFSKNETNIITSVPEAANYAEALNVYNVGVVVDFYHIEQNKEPLSGILDAGPYLVHAHTADTDRKAPGTGSYDYNGFFGKLYEVAYDERVSIECRWDDFEKELAPALEFMKRKWSEVVG